MRLTVKCGHSQDCMVGLPQSIAQTLRKGIGMGMGRMHPVALALRWNDRKKESRAALVGWNGKVAASGHFLEIGSVFAGALGLREGDVVNVDPAGDVPTVTSVFVDPVSEDD